MELENILSKLNEIDYKLDFIISKLPKAYKKKDKEIVEQFFNSRNIYDFLDRSTSDCLKEYNDYKNIVDKSFENMTQNRFNKILRNLYPNIYIKRTTLKGRQVCVYKREN